MFLAIKGVFLDGLSSKRHQARLELGVDSQSVKITIENDAENPQQDYRFDFTQIKIQSRLGNTPREISFGDEQLFITEDNQKVSELTLHVKGKDDGSLLHKLESKLIYVAGFTVAAVVIMWAGIVYGIPGSAKAIAYQLPHFTTEQMDATLSILDKTMLDPSELKPERQKQIRELFAKHIETHEYLNPHLEFRSGIGPNALALPSGHIIFTDEIIELAENDNELLAILFHELGHLEHRHMLRRMIQDSIITLSVIMITGDVDSFDLVTGIPTLLMDLSYSRDFEREADTYALEQLQKNNLDPQYFATIMQSLNDFYKAEKHDGIIEDGDEQQSSHINTDFLSTHPATEDRIKFVEQFKATHSK